MGSLQHVSGIPVLLSITLISKEIFSLSPSNIVLLKKYTDVKITSNAMAILKNLIFIFIYEVI